MTGLTTKKENRSTMKNNCKMFRLSREIAGQKGELIYISIDKRRDKKKNTLAFRLLDLKMFLYIVSNIPYIPDVKSIPESLNFHVMTNDFVREFDIDKSYRKGAYLREIKECLENLSQSQIRIGKNDESQSPFKRINIFTVIGFSEDYKNILFSMNKWSLRHFCGNGGNFHSIMMSQIKNMKSVREFMVYLWLKNFEDKDKQFKKNIRIGIDKLKRELVSSENLGFLDEANYESVETPAQKATFLKTFLGLKAKNNKKGYLEYTTHGNRKIGVMEYINTYTDLNVKASVDESKKCLVFNVKSKLGKEDFIRSLEMDCPADTHVQAARSDEEAAAVMVGDYASKLFGVLLKRIEQNDYEDSYKEYLSDMIFHSFDAKTTELRISVSSEEMRNRIVADADFRKLFYRCKAMVYQNQYRDEVKVFFRVD